MKVIVKKPYLKYAIGQEIEVRPQDAALLLPRGVVALPEVEDQVDPEVEQEPVKPKRKK